MVRVVVAAVLVLAAAGCKQPPPTRASVGHSCSMEDTWTCLGSAEALVCVDGKYELMPCRERCTTGRMGEGIPDTCTNQTYLPGEYCPAHMAPNDGVKHDCSVDRKSQLRCVGKHWQLEKPCPGKHGCRRVTVPVSRSGTRAELKCDEWVTEVGAACAKEDQFACAPDFKRSLRCVKGSWQQDQVCRGKDGCKETGDKVRCDETLAAVGDACIDDGDQACSVERDARLVCKGKKMVREKKCQAGCVVVTGKVRAGREGPSFECN